MRFLEDCRAVLDVWVRRPSLLFITVALDLVVIGARWHTIGWLVTLPVTLFGIGWLGTQRVWYARLFADPGARMPAREAWATTWKLFGRFVALGFVLFVPTVVFVFAGGLFGRWVGTLLTVAWLVVVDISLTFTVPVLVFHDPEPGGAIRTGVAMLRDTWPGSAWHALLPPLALVFVTRAGVASLAASVALTLLTSPFACLARGAILRFYLDARTARPVTAAFSGP